MFTLVNFLPSCLETLVIDPEVCGQIKSHDVAGASVRAAWFRISTQRLNFHNYLDEFINNTNHW